MAERLDRLGMSRLIADKIARNPALLEIGLANIARWLAKGSDQPHKLQEWRDRILVAQRHPEALDALLALLRQDSEAAAFEREFAPFAGVLTAEEVDAFYNTCAFAH
jgi:hypothetical protein